MAKTKYKKKVCKISQEYLLILMTHGNCNVWDTFGLNKTKLFSPYFLM